MAFGSSADAASPRVDTATRVNAAQRLDVITSFAGLMSSDGLLPDVGTVAAPRDADGVYLPPDPGQPTRPSRREGADTDAASFGPSSIIGGDERTQTADTTRFPWRAIATVDSASTQCSGWMVGPDLLLTAGHCVYDYTGFVRDLVVVPGRDGDREPFGRCGAVRAYTMRAFAETGEKGGDWGLVELDCQVGEQTGWFGLRAAGSDVAGQTVVVAGYPIDRPKDTQWWSSDRIRSVYPDQLSYGGDTYAGESGSPAYLVDGPCVPCVVAVHAYGVGATPDGLNSGTRIGVDIVATVAALRGPHALGSSPGTAPDGSPSDGHGPATSTVTTAVAPAGAPGAASVTTSVGPPPK